MVTQVFFLSVFLSGVVFSCGAFALSESTQADLAVMEDALRFAVDKNPKAIDEWFPCLVAPPQPYWQKSQSDFAGAVWQILKNSFPQNQKDLLSCPECSESRSFVGHDGRLSIQQGELTAVDLHHLRAQPNYQRARALLTTKETATGIELRITSLSHGEVLFYKLADHRQSLEQAVQPLRLAKELERRESGKALSYVFIDWGWTPKMMFQVEFLEQWGARNQNLSGLVLSFLEPTGAIGGTYRYLLPYNRRLNLSASVFVTLESLTKSSSNKQSPWAMVSQGMAQYAFSGNYAVFGSINSKGAVSVGITFLNPVLFPFLL